MKNKLLSIKRSIIFLLSLLPAISFAQESNRFSKLKIGILTGIENRVGSSRESGTALTQVIGWYILPGLAVGPGAGVVNYSSPSVTTIPLYGSLNYTPQANALGLTLYGNLGYGFATNRDTSGGLVAEAGLGWRFPLGRWSSLGPEIGYRQQGYHFNFGEFGSMNYKLKTLSLGIVLNY